MTVLIAVLVYMVALVASYRWEMRALTRELHRNFPRPEGLDLSERMKGVLRLSAFVGSCPFPFLGMIISPHLWKDLRATAPFTSRSKP